MIGEAMQRHLGTACTYPPTKTFSMMILKHGETVDRGLDQARAANQTVGTMSTLHPESMRMLHQRLEGFRSI